MVGACTRQNWLQLPSLHNLDLKKAGIDMYPRTLSAVAIASTDVFQHLVVGVM